MRLLVQSHLLSILRGEVPTGEEVVSGAAVKCPACSAVDIPARAAGEVGEATEAPWPSWPPWPLLRDFLAADGSPHRELRESFEQIVRYVVAMDPNHGSELVVGVCISSGLALLANMLGLRWSDEYISALVLRIMDRIIEEKRSGKRWEP